VGIAAAVALYAILISVAEPLRSLAASAQDDTIVTLTITDTLANTCDATIDIGTITGTGDSSSNNGYDTNDDVTCTVQTNNTTGYTFGWLVTTGTGTAGARTGTGHMNGYVSGNRIAPLKPAGANVPEVFNTSTIASTDARWAARLSHTSTTNSGAGIDWSGATSTTDYNGANDRWLNVATGSTVNIAKRLTATTGGGDSELIGFRAIIGSSKIQPTDIYKVTVIFTATTNP
jgi:hypothetical protein